MVVCGKVAIFTVSLASPPNGKVDGVLLGTVLHTISGAGVILIAFLEAGAAMMVHFGAAVCTEQ